MARAKKKKPAKGLTEKQKRFVTLYCLYLNATRAAKEAGYSEDTAFSIGPENLRKPLIAQAVKEKLAEMAMPVEEALKRLGDMARGTMDDFVVCDDAGNPRLVIPKDKPEALALMKKMKVTENVTTYDGAQVVTTKTEFELHDPKDAIDKILKVAGVYSEGRKLMNPDGSPIIPPVTKIEIVHVKPKG